MECAESLKESIKDKIKSSDKFSKSITLTFNGEDNYKSIFGGIWSLAMLCFIWYTAIVLFIQMVRRE